MPACETNTARSSQAARLQLVEHPLQAPADLHQHHRPAALQRRGELVQVVGGGHDGHQLLALADGEIRSAAAALKAVMPGTVTIRDRRLQIARNSRRR